MKDHGRRGFVTLSILAVAGLAMISALATAERPRKTSEAEATS